MLDHQPERVTAKTQVAGRHSAIWLWLVGGALLVALDMWAFQSAEAVWAQVLFGLLSGAALVWAVIRPDRQP
jgi:glucose uptake protein GlcU